VELVVARKIGEGGVVYDESLLGSGVSGIEEKGVGRIDVGIEGDESGVGIV